MNLYSGAMADPRRVIIVGSGPAGLTAALYTGRANLKPLLFAGPSLSEPPLPPGGQLMLTTEVENYPGFPHGIQGPELMDHFRKQAERFGTDVLDQTVEAVDFSRRPFRVQSDGTWHEAHAVIVSTGASPRLLGLESEKRLFNRGVSSCATCDGAFFKGKEVAVMGGGDSAMEEANFLTRLCSKVTVVHRSENFRASKIMVERARKNPKIAWKTNRVVKEFLGDKKLSGVLLTDVATKKDEELKVDGAFIAIGHVPNTQIFRDFLACEETGYLMTAPALALEAAQGKRKADEALLGIWKRHATATSVPGVFACGDVQDHVYRQAVTSAGSGCMAAIDAERFLESQGR